MLGLDASFTSIAKKLAKKALAKKRKDRVRGYNFNIEDE